MMSAAQDPVSYAAIWNRSRDREVYAAGLERWTRYFDELGLEAIGLGAVVLRRLGCGTPWVRADHLADSITVAAGAHIERLFEAEDRLAALADDAVLLAQRFRTVADHALHHVLTPADSGGYATASEVRLQGGLPFRGSIDPFTAQMLARCNGTVTLADVASAIATEHDLDPTKFSAACAGIARRLIASGFLVL
jgi:hypothetical protein